MVVITRSPTRWSSTDSAAAKRLSNRQQLCIQSQCCCPDLHSLVQLPASRCLTFPGSLAAERQLSSGQHISDHIRIELNADGHASRHMLAWRFTPKGRRKHALASSPEDGRRPQTSSCSLLSSAQVGTGISRCKPNQARICIAMLRVWSTRVQNTYVTIAPWSETAT